MKTYIHETPADIGALLAARIVAGIRAANEAGRAYVLGCPGGRSAMPVYEALATQLAADAVDCSRLIIAMMDEYLLAGPGRRALAAAGLGALFLPRFRRARDSGTHQRRPAEDIAHPGPRISGCPTLPRLPTTIGASPTVGGIDLFLLASGAGDGHIAFNPPGSPRDSRSRVVKLAEQTRRDNLATFPDFKSLDEVPTHGITIGIASIAELSKAAAMIVWGEGKRTAYRRISGTSVLRPVLAGDDRRGMPQRRTPCRPGCRLWLTSRRAMPMRSASMSAAPRPRPASCASPTGRC